MIHFNPEIRVTRENPHCIGWARATASLWGHCADHDLDEPVLLSETTPVRTRQIAERDNCLTLFDRNFKLLVLRTAVNAVIRVAYSNGVFIDLEIVNVRTVGQGQTVQVSAC